MSSASIIRLLRTVEGVSQTALAKKLKISRVYLSQIENGHREPSLELLRQISHLLRVPVALLVIDDNDTSDVARALQNILGDVLAAKLKAGKREKPKAENKKALRP